MNKIYDFLIIGGGASGLFLANFLDKKNSILLEKNSSFGKKILASGGGRCNITNKNIDEKFYLGDKEFIKNTIFNLNYKDLLEYFSPLKFSLEKNSQFFCKEKSKAILYHLIKNLKTDYKLNCEVKSVSKNGEIFTIFTNLGELKCKNLIIASGGLSYKILGASDIGFKIAKNFGIEFATTKPALCGFSVQKDQFWFKKLSGISLFANVKYENYEFYDEILFTHRGISGPAILNASLFWEKSNIQINFLPNFDIKNLEKSKKSISNSIPLPKRFILEFLNSKNLIDKNFNYYNNIEKKEILEIFNYRFAPSGNFGYLRAEITKGGIKSNELDENFQSLKIKNLYFIGEILNVAAMVGGYNLHFAFSSAFKLAKFLNYKK